MKKYGGNRRKKNKKKFSIGHNEDCEKLVQKKSKSSIKKRNYFL